eukprot:g9105.t1
MSIARLCIVVFAVCAMVAFVDSARPAPYDICSFSCVKRIYRDYCGGASCVYGPSNELEKAYLCSEPCIEALSGTYMLRCLQNKDPYRIDFEDVIATKMQEVKSFCVDIASVGAIELEEKVDLIDLD